MPPRLSGRRRASLRSDPCGSRTSPCPRYPRPRRGGALRRGAAHPDRRGGRAHTPTPGPRGARAPPALGAAALFGAAQLILRAAEGGLKRDPQGLAALAAVTETLADALVLPAGGAKRAGR